MTKKRWILNRSVRVDGQVYEAGTPLEQIPKDAQPSIRDTGWASEIEPEIEPKESTKRFSEEIEKANAERIAAEKAEADRKAADEAAAKAEADRKAADEAAAKAEAEAKAAEAKANAAAEQSKPTDGDTNSATGESNPQSNPPQSESNQASGADDRLLSDKALDIDADKLELLANNDPPITTVQQAKDYVAVNKSFRTIAGIGKAGNAELMKKLGL